MMKLSTQYRTISVLTMAMWSVAAYAQAREPYTIQVDTLTKVLGIGVTIGGFFLGYMQMRMANKIAEVEARFNKAITDVKENFANTLHNEADKLENKIQLSQKEIENKMATKGDITNLERTIGLQHDNIKQGHEGLREQLRNALKIFGLKDRDKT